MTEQQYAEHVERWVRVARELREQGYKPLCICFEWEEERPTVLYIQPLEVAG